MNIENCKIKVTNLGEPCADESPIYKFQISNFKSQILFLLALGTLLFALCPTSSAQIIPDKIVATVNNGSQMTPDVITYSDLVWQLALEPERTFNPRPTSAELNEALRTLEDQLLVLQEARKLPVAQAGEAQKLFEESVSEELNDLVRHFPSRVALEERMKAVGLTSEQLDQIMRDRATTDRYIDFRFRAFAVVSPQEISDRYDELVRKLRGSGQVVPKLDEVRDRIESQLREDKIRDNIDKFKDKLREQPSTEIVLVNPV